MAETQQKASQPDTSCLIKPIVWADYKVSIGYTIDREQLILRETKVLYGAACLYDLDTKEPINYANFDGDKGRALRRLRTIAEKQQRHATIALQAIDAYEALERVSDTSTEEDKNEPNKEHRV